MSATTKFGNLIFVVCIFLAALSFAQTTNGLQNRDERMTRIKLQLSNKDSVYKRVSKDLDFIQLKVHDTVADIGSYDGYHPSVYSIFSDSVVFYLNDITTTGFTYFDSIQMLCTKIRGTKPTDQFKIQIGTESSTKLPTKLFNKVILRDALHHFRSQDSMLNDIKRIMKPGAKLILFEPLREEGVVNHQLCKGAMTRKELLALMDRNGFGLTINKEGTEQTKMCVLPNGKYCWYEFKFSREKGIRR
jgi:hypothetical protein